MEDYVNLPSQQLANLVKRYMHFRRANEIEGIRTMRVRVGS